MGHSDASAEGDLALGLDSMKLGQDAAGVRGECGQYFTVTGIWGKHFHDFRSKQVSLNYVRPIFSLENLKITVISIFQHLKVVNARNTKL